MSVQIDCRLGRKPHQFAHASTHRRWGFRPSLLAIALLLAVATARGGDDLAALEQQAMQAAVARVAPSVVRIDFRAEGAYATAANLAGPLQ